MDLIFCRLQRMLTSSARVKTWIVVLGIVFLYSASTILLEGNTIATIKTLPGSNLSWWLPGRAQEEPPRTRIPRQIWSLWDQGVHNAPPMQRTCLWSQRAANPSFVVTQLDMKGAINATGLFEVIEPSVWKKMKIQAKRYEIGRNRPQVVNKMFMPCI